MSCCGLLEIPKIRSFLKLLTPKNPENVRGNPGKKLEIWKTIQKHDTSKNNILFDLFPQCALFHRPPVGGGPP